MIELEHSPLGGSGAHRFLNCDGSFLLHRQQLQDGTFENVTSEFATLGTDAHEAAAVCLTKDIEPFELINNQFGGNRVGWENEISLDALQVYVNDCRSIMALANDKGTKLIEQTITLPELHPLLKGTVDFGLWSSKLGVFLRDYKNGEGIGVGAVDNEQLLYYAFLMIMSEPWLRDGPRDLPVNLGIVQPNFYGVYEAVRPWITTLGYVRDWGLDVLLPQMDHLMVTKYFTDKDFNTGEHCQFCPVLIDCPKMQKAFESYRDASEDFVTMLTNEELNAYYADRENARRFMKVLENVVYARLVGGGDIPNAKLVEKRTARVWKPGSVAVLEATFGEKAYKPRTIESPAGIEKLSTRGKELALEYGYKPEAGSLVVAPLSDPRAAAKPVTNASVFATYAQSNEELGW